MWIYMYLKKSCIFNGTSIPPYIYLIITYFACKVLDVFYRLFALPKLIHLDISYNKLTFIQNEIANMRYTHNQISTVKQLVI